MRGGEDGEARGWGERPRVAREVGEEAFGGEENCCVGRVGCDAGVDAEAAGVEVAGWGGDGEVGFCEEAEAVGDGGEDEVCVFCRG